MGWASSLFLNLGLCRVKKTVSRLLSDRASDGMTFAHKWAWEASASQPSLELCNLSLCTSQQPLFLSSDRTKELKAFGACYRGKFLCVQNLVPTSLPPQVQQRAQECIKALNLILKINSGEEVTNVLHSDFDWNSLKVSEKVAAAFC